MEAETVFKFLELNEKIKNMGLILKAFWRLRFHVCEGSLLEHNKITRVVDTNFWLCYRDL